MSLPRAQLKYVPCPEVLVNVEVFTWERRPLTAEECRAAIAAMRMIADRFESDLAVRHGAPL